MQLVGSLTADPGVVSLILAWSNSFVGIEHEIFSTSILLLSLIQEGLFQLQVKVCASSYKRKYVHKVLVNHLVELAQEKIWYG